MPSSWVCSVLSIMEEGNSNFVDIDEEGRREEKGGRIGAWPKSQK